MMEHKQWVRVGYVIGTAAALAGAGMFWLALHETRLWGRFMAAGLGLVMAHLVYRVVSTLRRDAKKWKEGL
jgi:hypothetical protein